MSQVRLILRASLGFEANSACTYHKLLLNSCNSQVALNSLNLVPKTIRTFIAVWRMGMLIVKIPSRVSQLGYDNCCTYQRPLVFPQRICWRGVTLLHPLEGDLLFHKTNLHAEMETSLTHCTYGNVNLRLWVPTYHAITGAIFMQPMPNSYSARHGATVHLFADAIPLFALTCEPTTNHDVIMTCA